MQLHNLARKTENRKKKTIGRGGTRGKTSGRGTKGQNSRAGRKKRPEMRDIIKKLPKLRGRGKNIFQSFQAKSAVVNLADLNIFDNGAKVNPNILLAAKLISKKRGLTPPVKILSNGNIEKKLVVSGCMVSTAAKAKIEKVGGSVS
ncbi:MAG: 50S ribosomal protein L15 [Candidatus Paceibacterota bacterium]|jgi:large subunit ribosomal protein L15